MGREQVDLARLQTAFNDHYRAVFSYAKYRTMSIEDAQEIAASTFASAWRKVCEMPCEPDTLRWLYGVSKKHLANQRRAISRRCELNNKLTRQPRVGLGELTTDGRLEEAMTHLSADQQRLLRMSAWDELSYLEGAATLQCSANAYAIRLHRARQALKHALANDRDRVHGFGPPASR